MLARTTLSRQPLSNRISALVHQYSSSASCLGGRSAWKGPYIDPSLLNPDVSVYKNAKIMSRRSVIPMSFIGLNVFIHNGKEFKKVTITREKVGYRFGEFAATRKFTYKPKATAQKKK